MRSDSGNTSGVAIENLYSDAHDILSELQATYLFALKKATQMAISIGAYRGYDDYRAFNLESYENGALEFDMRPKPLFQDKLSTEKMLNLTLQAAKSEAADLILPKLGYSPEDVAMLALKRDERDRQNVRAAFDNLMGLSAEEEAAQRLSDDDSEEYADTPNRARME
jgi:hypothetical protein